MILLISHLFLWLYLDKTIPEKTSSKPPPVETNATQSESALNSKDRKHNDKPKTIGSPVVVPVVSNIIPPKSHVPTNQDPKQSLNPSIAKQVVNEKPKEKPAHNVCTNQNSQMNNGQPPKSVPNPNVQKRPTVPKPSDAKNSTIRKNPKKSKTY